MKGIITLNVEVDYSTMLDENNQGAIYLFTGAKSIDEMIQLHMDRISEEIVQPLVNKPLIRYSLDGKLIRDVIEAPQEIPSIEEPEAELEPEVTIEEPQDIELLPEVSQESSTVDLVANLDEAIEYVSMELGIPQKIKANHELVGQLNGLVGFRFKEDLVAEYKGFPVEQEGMEESFIIVYKTYSGSEIKFYSIQ